MTTAKDFVAGVKRLAKERKERKMACNLRREKLEKEYLAECETWHCSECNESFLVHLQHRPECPYCGATARTLMADSERNVVMLTYTLRQIVDDDDEIDEGT